MSKTARIANILLGLVLLAAPATAQNHDGSPMLGPMQQRIEEMQAQLQGLRQQLDELRWRIPQQGQMAMAGMVGMPMMCGAMPMGGMPMMPMQGQMPMMDMMQQPSPGADHAHGGGPAVEALRGSVLRMHQGMGVALSGDADRDFASLMIAHHQGAIDMAKVELERGQDAELRAFAERVIKAQTREIETLQAWLGKPPE